MSGEFVGISCNLCDLVGNSGHEHSLYFPSRKSQNRQSGSIISHHPLVSSHQSSTISDLSSTTPHQPAVISGHSSVIYHQSSVVSTYHHGQSPPSRSTSRPQMVSKNHENASDSGPHASPRAHIRSKRSVPPPGSFLKGSRASRTSKTG